MSDGREYRLKIDVFTPTTMPMARLAEYMAELAKLLGEQGSVHFSHLEKGSAVLVSKIEQPAIPKIGDRLGRVRRGDATKDAMQAYKALDTLLAKDNAVGVLTEGKAHIITFPGRNRPKPVRYGPFREEGTLEGVVIRIGGRDETIPVWLQDAEGVEYVCQTSLELSKLLAPLYRSATIRAYGSGKWLREESGQWTLQQFDIARFETINDAPLSDVVSQLRAVRGAEWGTNADLGDVVGIRSGEESQD